MIILAIEASAQAASVALVTQELTLAEVTVNTKKNHSITLMPMIEFMFQTVGFDISKVDYIAVTTGPGSFTGIRIGVATAKALAHGTGKKLLGVPTLDALAYNVFDENNIVVPVMDARRNQVYTCFYEWSEGNIQRLTEYMAIDIDECIKRASAYKRNVIFLGDGIAVYGQRILDADKCFRLAPANNNMQRASSVALAGMSNLEWVTTYDKLEIFYLRKSQAEREYEEKLSCLQ